jgi:hypothetical protein
MDVCESKLPTHATHHTKKARESERDRKRQKERERERIHPRSNLIAFGKASVTSAEEHMTKEANKNINKNHDNHNTIRPHLLVVIDVLQSLSEIEDMSGIRRIAGDRVHVTVNTLFELSSILQSINMHFSQSG